MSLICTPHSALSFSRELTSPQLVSNIEHFRSLCAEHVCTSVFALRVEDFVYASTAMKKNYVALLAEMFHLMGAETAQIDWVGRII